MTKLRMRFSLLFLSLLIISIHSCKKSEKFSTLANQVASPIDVANDSSGNYFYALNTDYPRDYNQGSLMVLNTDGTKLSVTPVPRLGKSLTVAGNTLIVTFADSLDVAPQVMLFDITQPAQPVLAATFFPDDCTPINAMAKASYSYWAVACSNGKLFAGQLNNPLSTSTLTFVRNYPAARRAMYIDTARNLLIAFPTNMGPQVWGDQLLDDSQSYDNNGIATATPNEIPDVFENNAADRANPGRRGLYQFAVYDLADAAANSWPYKDFTLAPNELHFVYFNLSNFDGSPDITQTTSNITMKYYRTNFWSARPDPDDADVFYLSQRGSADPNHGGSQYANSIIKVTIKNNLKSTTLTTEDLLSFERVYGFKGELNTNGRQYPGDFRVQTIQGKPMLVVNHFRDLANWPGQGYFSIAAKILGENHWFDEIISTSVNKTYYQIAVTPSGRAMAANFYGNSLILLDVAPGVAINERLNIQ